MKDPGGRSSSIKEEEIHMTATKEELEKEVKFLQQLLTQAFNYVVYCRDQDPEDIYAGPLAGKIYEVMLKKY